MLHTNEEIVIRPTIWQGLQICCCALAGQEGGAGRGYWLYYLAVRNLLQFICRLSTGNNNPGLKRCHGNNYKAPTGSGGGRQLDVCGKEDLKLKSRQPLQMRVQQLSLQPSLHLEEAPDSPDTKTVWGGESVLLIRAPGEQRFPRVILRKGCRVRVIRTLSHKTEGKLPGSFQRHVVAHCFPLRQLYLLDKPRRVRKTSINFVSGVPVTKARRRGTFGERMK